ncbi:LOW QUALITY PROTEIN: centromere-associated protein E [Sphaeramia orbicularis]|uniref:LOW QUALITY PROTEIN: centromere-associated protein E n=1 Tax=Sphaeramia orbicularis TaxID=375764 RepID=UPI00117F6B93|nr:LOW QUALITY PROTEIN: centromere-associated protein E [Sphaeramia orbicularis]
MSEDSAVKVCVRVRPLITREESSASENAEPVQLYWKADKKSIYQTDDGNSTKSFSFDRVFTADETTDQLYRAIAKPLVVSTVEGYNGTIFAYGQTSSGKTFTMMGNDHILGVIPLAVEDVFQTIKTCPKKEFLLRVSYMEIYNETVTDLLVDSWKRKPLEVRETINKNIYVADLTEELVTSPAQALAWIRKGEKNRHYGKTKMNQRSSRSHTIFRMILESRERSDSETADGAIIVSHLNLVDLAGSERASQTGAEGTRFKEGCNINRSLFTLGQVIKKLTDESQKGFTNYRDSKLTRILQNSLGGNAKTVIICTITAAALDETLSTLQFASTAKKMKNDPHVTEVSDDGALLKRYRNEIVDLKRRLHEVSSVTQTTATEKEVLSQLLQEKDQLQREQEDRIKNLTKLLVTSSNLVPVKRMPKRRVTWGGKMLRLTPESTCPGGSSDLSFAESSTQKRKADRSCLLELAEEDEDFYPHWEIPEEPSDDMDVSQASVTVRSFGDSPKDFVSPDRIRELSGRVSSLELQVEVESRQKEEAMAAVESLNGRVSELELQLQEEAQHKQEAVEKSQAAEQRSAELDVQLRTEAQHKQEAMEKVEMLEFRVADLERRLEEQGHTQKTDSDQMTREFAESVQLCERLSSEKDAIVAERDYLKQEVGMFMEQIQRLEKEKAVMSQELVEQKETEEFKKLEEEFRKDQEAELQEEISNLKKAGESSEIKCVELQNKLEALSEELKKKTELVEELQNMCGKDLVKEVAMLQRSLDDAEGVGRDAKKEWAFLRSRNIALEERDVTLTAIHEKMEAEVHSLRSQLETEKAHFKKMQIDLQKELNVAFAENTKLITLLDGKVPKSLIDSVELERTVTQLNTELAVRLEAEGVLRAQLEELESLRELPVQVDHLTKQVSELSAELFAVQSQKDSLLSELTNLQEKNVETQEELQHNCDQMNVHKQRESDLEQEVVRLSQELQCLRAEKDCALASSAPSSAEDMDKLLSTVAALTAERDQLKTDMQENVDMMIENQEELRAALEKNRKQKELIEELEAAETCKQDSPDRDMNVQLEELQMQIKSMSEELQSVRADRDRLLNERTEDSHRSSQDMDQLLCTVTTLTEERDQLQDILEELRQDKQQLRAQLEDQLDTLQSEITHLNASVHTVNEQKRQLEEELHHNIHMVSTTQELLKSVQEELCEQKQINSDLKALRHNEETLNQQVQTLTEKLQSTEAERDHLLSEKQTDSQSSSQEMEKLLCTVTALKEERDQLQDILEELRQDKQQLRAQLEDRVDTLQSEAAQTQSLLHAAQEELHQQNQKSSDLMKSMSEELQSVRADRDRLLNERTEDSHRSSQDMDQLLCTVTTLTEERDQLQDILEELRQDKQQLRAQLEDQLDTLQSEITHLNASVHTVNEQKRQLEEELHHNIHMVSTTQELLKSVQEELCEQKQINSDLKALRHNEETLNQQVQTLTEKLQSTEAERDHLLSEKQTDSQSSSQEMEKLLCTVTALKEERDQLQDILEELRQDKQQLRAQLEDRVDTLQSEAAQTQSLLHAAQEELHQQNQKSSDLMKSMSEELQSVRADRDRLLNERTEDSHRSSQDMDQLLCTVTTLTEERDQLQDILEELRQDKQQLRAQLEDQLDTLQSEITHLNASVHTVNEQKRQLEEELHHSIHMVSTTQELLKSVRRIFCEQKQINSDLKALRHNEETLNQQVQTLTEKLQSTEAEMDHLLSEKQTDSQSSSQEMEKLLCTVTALKEERDQLQDILEELRQDKQQLRAQLEDRVDTLQSEVGLTGFTLKITLTFISHSCIKYIAGCSSEQNWRTGWTRFLPIHIPNVLQDSSGVEGAASNVHEKQAEAEASQQLLSEANRTISELREQLRSSDQKELLSALLQNSTVELQTAFRNFQGFADTCSSVSSMARDQCLGVKCSLNPLPESKSTMAVYSAVCRLRLQSLDTLGHIATHIKSMSEELQSVRADRDRLLNERTEDSHRSSQDMDQLLCTVTTLTEERDQLQDILEELRQDKQQLRAQLEDQLDTLQSEITHLNASVHTVNEQKRQLEEELHHNIHMVSTTQELLKSVQEELCEQKQINSDLKALRTQRGDLKSTEGPSLSEKQTDSQSSSQEMEKLLCTVTALKEERDQLQDILEELRQDKQQLRAQLEDRVDTLQSEITHLNASVHTVNEQKRQLEEELHHNIHMVSTTQELLKSVQEELCEQKQINSDLKALRHNEETLNQQVQTLTEKLQSTEAERDHLLSEKQTDSQSSSQEMEKLLCTVTALKEERDQLQDILEELRQDKQQLRAQLEDRVDTLQSEAAQTQSLLHAAQEELHQQNQKSSDLMKSMSEELQSVRADRDRLLNERTEDSHRSSQDMDQLLCTVTTLTEERDQLQDILEELRQDKQQLRAQLEDQLDTLQSEITHLNASVHTVNEQKRQLEEELHHSIHMVSTTQELLKSVQEDLCEQKQINSDLKALRHNEETLNQQVQTLTEKLQSTEAERDHLLSEKQTDSQSSSQEMEKLLCTVTALKEERDQLQDILEELRQDKQQLRAQLEDRVDTLQSEVQELKEQLQTFHEKQAEAEASQQLLSEANRTISELREQLRSSDQKELLSALLQNSTVELQTAFRNFQGFADTCSSVSSMARDQCLGVKCSLNPLPESKSTMAVYSAVCRLRLQSLDTLGHIAEHLQAHTHCYKNLFDALINNDLSFEERRLQDVLLCKTQAPSYSIKDEDFHSLWKPRVTELLDRRQLYLQKMGGTLEKLRTNLVSFRSEVTTELREMEWFKEQLKTQTYSNLEGILNCELERRSALIQNRTRTLQDMTEEHTVLMRELKLLEVQSHSELRQEKRKRSTLLQALEGAPLQTQVDLLKDNQQLLLQLQQAEDQVKSVRVENEELKEARVRASERMSNHKQATQLLQTELQDSRARVQDQENTIQTLKNKLQEAQKNASPSAVELEKLKTKVFKMEMELSLSSDKHQQEIQKLTASLKEKEESLRRLKLNLRSQQQEDESFLQGKDLHARLTKPKGVVVQSSIALEKGKLEEEVAQLQLRITELQSLVSSQQTEINKWKSRAFRMKGQSETTKAQSPSKHTHALLTDPQLMASPKRLRRNPNQILDSPRKGAESPRKGAESPKVSMLDFPKSRFFGADASSELLSTNCPKQFFDNSALGTIPGASVDTDQKGAWSEWPTSPKPEDICKTQ